MIVIQGHLRLRPEDVERLREIAAPMLAASQAEAGCILYTYAEDIREAGLVHICERWADQSALDAHTGAPHFRAFAAALGKLDVQELRVVAFDAEAERVLVGS